MNSSHIRTVCYQFISSKLLFAAVDLNLFTFLSSGPKSGKEIQKELGLHDRSLYDFLDTLTILGFLQRTGLLETSLYSNTPESETFLVKNKPGYLGNMLSMFNHRLYPAFGKLEDSLKTGLPYETNRNPNVDLFDTVYEDTSKAEEFILAMRNVQMINFISLAQKFSFSRYKTLCDAGGADGSLSVTITQHYPHIKCITYDIPKVEPYARRYITSMGLSDKIEIMSGDFFQKIPKADVITFGNILHDWDEEKKLLLIKNAYDSLNEDGVMIAIEKIIDDDRRVHLPGLLSSLVMLVDLNGGSNFTFADFNGWVKKVGFKRTEIFPLDESTGASAVLAFKNDEIK